MPAIHAPQLALTSPAHQLYVCFTAQNVRVHSCSFATQRLDSCTSELNQSAPWASSAQQVKTQCNALADTAW